MIYFIPTINVSAPGALFTTPFAGSALCRASSLSTHRHGLIHTRRPAPRPPYTPSLRSARGLPSCRRFLHQRLRMGSTCTGSARRRYWARWRCRWTCDFSLCTGFDIWHTSCSVEFPAPWRPPEDTCGRLRAGGAARSASAVKTRPEVVGGLTL